MLTSFPVNFFQLLPTFGVPVVVHRSMFPFFVFVKSSVCSNDMRRFYFELLLKQTNHVSVSVDKCHEAINRTRYQVSLRAYGDLKSDNCVTRFSL